MSKLPGKIAHYLKGDPSTPTTQRTNSTEAYFSADVPLEGDRSSEVETLSERTNSNASPETSFVVKKKKNSVASSSHEDSVLKAGHAKDSTPMSARAEQKVDKGNARKRSASDILIGADFQDIMAMSALMREMNEKGLGEEEKAEKLLEMQMKREEDREAQKQGGGRSAGSV